MPIGHAADPLPTSGPLLALLCQFRRPPASTECWFVRTRRCLPRSPERPSIHERRRRPHPQRSLGLGLGLANAPALAEPARLVEAAEPEAIETPIAELAPHPEAARVPSGRPSQLVIDLDNLAQILRLFAPNSNLEHFEPRHPASRNQAVEAELKRRAITDDWPAAPEHGAGARGDRSNILLAFACHPASGRGPPPDLT